MDSDFPGSQLLSDVQTFFHITTLSYHDDNIVILSSPLSQETVYMGLDGVGSRGGSGWKKFGGKDE